MLLTIKTFLLTIPGIRQLTYAYRLTRERMLFGKTVNVHALPPIFHYWSNRYVRPWFEEIGTTHPEDLFCRYLLEAAKTCAENETPRFISIGSGNGDTEVTVAKMLKEKGLKNFTLECLDINRRMIGRGRELAEAEGVQNHLTFVCADFNHWIPRGKYHAVLANQCLHHVQNLEELFDAVGSALTPKGLFVTSDMIGRNGHQRWPEALAIIEREWQKIPEHYRYNHQRQKNERKFINRDYSKHCFEGIRSQDILPLLIERFSFHAFIAFGNLVDVFVDRAFGHNLDPDNEEDRAFIDRLHAMDEQGFADGTLSPTHLVAVMALPSNPSSSPYYARGLNPQQAVRQEETAP